MAPGPAAYLDSIEIGGIRFDNADADGCPDAIAAPCGSPSLGEEFVDYPDAPVGSGFNDRMVFISVGDLMRAVEKRVLGEVAIALNRYRDEHGSYPWLARFDNPRTSSFASDLARRGLLAVHLPGETFDTRLGGLWRFVDATPTTATGFSGDVSLVPAVTDVARGTIDVDGSTGWCVWSDWTVAECGGSRVIADHYRSDLGVSVERTVEFAFRIEDESPQVTAPTAGDVRRRALSVEGSPLPSGSLPTWNVRVTDRNDTGSGYRELSIDADTAGVIELSDIRYELSIVYDDADDWRDELPEWFVENDWHHFVYVALSEDAAPGGDADGDGDCTTPVSTCLTLTVEGVTARSDIQALVVTAGVSRWEQDRAIGDCDGDGVHDAFLCAYFEGANSDQSTPAAADTYARDVHSAEFNDQVRVVSPLPP